MITKIATCIGAVAVAALAAACGHPSSDLPPPATITKIPGSVAEKLQLTGPAANRLGIATTPVREASVAVGGTAGPHKVIPYAAVVYDTDGSSWTYVTIAPRTYLRQPITIAGIEDSSVVLSRGPAVGAQVVTVGAPELLGTEYNISGEQ